MGAIEARCGDEALPWTYRDALPALVARWRALATEPRARAADAAATRAYAARAGRATFGGTLVASALALAATAVADGSTVGVLLGAWVAAVALGLVGRVAGWSRARALRAEEAPASQDALVAAIARLEAGQPSAALADAARRLELASAGLPLVGVALLAPLTLHLAASAALGTRDFDAWVRLSLVLVGHCHVVLAVLGWRFAKRLRDAPPATVNPAGAGFGAVGWTVVASLLPGMILLFVPVVLVAVTGALFAPPAFAWVAARVRAERAALDGLAPGSDA